MVNGRLAWARLLAGFLDQKISAGEEQGACTQNEDIKVVRERWANLYVQCL
jgi:hypothetical protein